MGASLTSPGLPDSTLGRWLYALKPASWPKLVVPALFGQLLGASIRGQLSLAALAWGLAFTGLGLGFIVLLNDWGDRSVDGLKREMFPDECSPKTIPDGILGSANVGVAGFACGVAAVLVAAGAGVALERPFALVGGLGCMLVFVAYTLPPVRLNYRGGGELLEMLGVGVALPLYNLYLQGAELHRSLLPWISGFALMSLGSAVASGLSDEESDRAGGKRTFASVFGNRAARRLTEASVGAGAGVWALAAVLRPEWVPWWAVLPALAAFAWNFLAMRRVSPRAVTNAFGAQGLYKRFLHGAIWHSTTIAAVVLWLHSGMT